MQDGFSFLCSSPFVGSDAIGGGALEFYAPGLVSVFRRLFVMGWFSTLALLSFF